MIRPALASDAGALSRLLEQLGYGNTQTFLERRIVELLEHPDAALFIYEEAHAPKGLLSLHTIPQIALLGSFLRISYFVVDETSRGRHIGAALEAYATQIAREKKCDRIEVHCHERRQDAHRFYEKHGYVESPKYFVKHLSCKE